MGLSDGIGWNETSPTDAGLISETGAQIRDLRVGIRIRVEKEHELPAAESAGGEHKAGSARTFIVADQASLPTKKPDGVTVLDVDDKGRISITLDTMTIFVWNGTVWAPAKTSQSIIKLTCTFDESASNFVAGMICTQEISGAIGYFLSKTSTTVYLQIVSGTFNNVNLINGSVPTGLPPIAFPSASTLYNQPVVLSEDYLFIEETLTGTLSDAKWNTRFVAASKIHDAGSNLTLVGNGLLRLTAGTYRFRIACPAYRVGLHRARLRKADGTVIREGTCAYASVAGDGQSDSTIIGRMVLATQTDLYVEHYVQFEFAGYGKGKPTGGPIPGSHNVIGTMEFWKERI